MYHREGGGGEGRKKRFMFLAYSASVLLIFKDDVKSVLRVGSAHKKGGPVYITIIMVS